VDGNPASCFRSALRRKLRMPNNPGRRRTASMIVPGKRGVSADTAVGLAAALGTSERFGWVCSRL
jgi:plasmid maintenance system antidote protein VapI